MEIKTNREKAELRKQNKLNEYRLITEKFLKLIAEGMTKSDATSVVANEFNCSLPTVYKARKIYGKRTAEC